MQEEVFGPVLAITPFRDDDEVVAMANNTRFGLAAGEGTGEYNRHIGRATRDNRSLRAP